MGLPERFYALVTQTDGEKYCKKFAFDKDKGPWYSVPSDHWLLRNHPEITKCISDIDKLKDGGRRTANVKLLTGKARTPTYAASLYINKNMKFQVQNVELPVEDPSDEANESAELLLKRFGSVFSHFFSKLLNDFIILFFFFFFKVF